MYEGLTPEQVQTLNLAISQGMQQTKLKAGSLKSMDNVRKILRQQAKTQPEIKPVLQRVDSVLDDAFAGSNRGYRTAEQLEDAYRNGYSYYLSGQTGLPPVQSRMQNNAFAQGTFKPILNNTNVDNNLAQEALQYGQVLENGLTPSQFGALNPYLQNNAMQFSQVAKLSQQAADKLKQAGYFVDDSMIEGSQDLLTEGRNMITQKLFGNSYNAAAKNLLNPNFVGKQGSIANDNLYLLNLLGQRYLDGTDDE